MRTFKIAVTAIAFLCCISTASAADNWVGVWGYSPSPLPPGKPLTPRTTAPAGDPLSELPAPRTPNVPGNVAGNIPGNVPGNGAGNGNGRGPRVDNPGNIPVTANDGRLSNVTVRQLVRVSAGGRQIRLRLSNEAGADPLPLGAIHVAEAGPDGSIVPGTDRPVTVDGRSGIIVPGEAPLLTDPIDLPVKPLDRLLISVYVPGTLPVPRGGRGAPVYMYVASSTGDNTAAASLPGARLVSLTPYVTGIQVNATQATNVIVTLGDSITEGTGTPGNAFHSWPDRLVDRLVAARKNWAVVNAGIGGNRLLRDSTEPSPSALARLDRDVLSVPGIKAIILLEGINDIDHSFSPRGQNELVTAESMIAADKQIIARAHERGIKVFGSPLLPNGGSGLVTPEGDRTRETLNNWIRNSGAFDGVIDFATPVSDPQNPQQFAKAYNDTDHLHPNEAGTKAMVDALDIDMITK